MANQDSEFLSLEGFEKLKKERDFLSNQRRKEIALALEEAKALGDLSENSEYQQAKEDQVANEMRIAELEDIIQRTVIIKRPPTDVVSVGVKVVAKKIIDNTRHEFSIVGPEEVNLEINKISHESPIGKAMMGKGKGMDVGVTTPRGVVSYTIIDILSF